MTGRGAARAMMGVVVVKRRAVRRMVRGCIIVCRVVCNGCVSKSGRVRCLVLKRCGWGMRMGCEDGL